MQLEYHMKWGWLPPSLQHKVKSNKIYKIFFQVTCSSFCVMLISLCVEASDVCDTVNNYRCMLPHNIFLSKRCFIDPLFPSQITFTSHQPNWKLICTLSIFFSPLFFCHRQCWCCRMYREREISVVVYSEDILSCFPSPSSPF